MVADPDKPHSAVLPSQSAFGVAQQEKEHAKRLRLERQHLATLDEAKLPLANPYVSEFENKELIPNRKFLIHPPKFILLARKLIRSPSRPCRSTRPE
jgi:hypothetical protein